MTPSSTHLVLIPSYNPGPRLLSTARAALAHWQPVWVVTDGSTDDSTAAIQQLATTEPHLRVLVRPANGGKGAAVLTAAEAALAAGFTHALVLDADGQHPEDRIAEFMAERYHCDVPYLIELNDSISCRVCNVVGKDICSVKRSIVLQGASQTGPMEDVVAENESHRIITYEFFADQKCLG